jgi:acyl carrier protein
METEKKQIIARLDILKILGNLLESWIEVGDTFLLNEKTNLLAGLGLDSVALLHLILGIEEKFQIAIKDHELDSAVFSKVGNLIDLIENKLNETN